MPLGAANDHVFGKTSMRTRLGKILWGAAFMLATLGATSALVAAGLNDEHASTLSSIVR